MAFTAQLCSAIWLASRCFNHRTYAYLRCSSSSASSSSSSCLSLACLPKHWTRLPGQLVAHVSLPPLPAGAAAALPPPLIGWVHLPAWLLLPGSCCMRTLAGCSTRRRCVLLPGNQASAPAVCFAAQGHMDEGIFRSYIQHAVHVASASCRLPGSSIHCVAGPVTISYNVLAKAASTVVHPTTLSPSHRM
jgi:hypothetical protein